MRDQLKSLSKETVVYGVSTVLGRFLNFLLVPFYVNVLSSTAEYGISTSLYTYIAFLNVIYPMGLEGAFFRYGARAEGEPFNPEKEKNLFSAPFFFILAVSLILSGLLFVFSPRMVWPVFHDPHLDIAPMVPMFTTLLRLGAGILFFDSLSILPFAVLRLEHRAWRFTAFRLFGIVLTLLLNFLFVMKFRWGVQGIFIANLAASLSVFLLLIPTVRERLTFRFDMTALKKMLPFGVTNVPANLSAMMVQVIDRPIVQAFLGLGMLGVYQANYRMGFVMMVLVGIFEYAWRPFFMRQALKDDAAARLLFARVLTLFLTVALVAFLGLSWGLPALLSWPFHGHRLLKEPYLVGLPIIPIILLAYVFQGLYTNFIAGIYIKERNKVLPYVTGLGALVNVVANVWLVPRIGIMGAALATLLAYMVMAGGLYWESQKVYPVPYQWRRLRFLAGTIFCVYGLGQLLLLAPGMATPGAVLFWRTGLFLVVLVVLWKARYFSLAD